MITKERRQELRSHAAESEEKRVSGIIAAPSTMLAILDALDAAERERDEARVALPRMPFDVRCADALADEVDALIAAKIIDSRSPAADALLDYRDPPRTPRSDALAEARAECERLRAELATARDAALEDAAAECDGRAFGAFWPTLGDATGEATLCRMQGAEACADAIRALKTGGGK